MCNTHRHTNYHQLITTNANQQHKLLFLSPFLTCPVVVVVVRLLAAAEAEAEAAKVLLAVQEEEVAVEVPNWAIACDDDAAALPMHSDEPLKPLVSGCDVVVQCDDAMTNEYNKLMLQRIIHFLTLSLLHVILAAQLDRGWRLNRETLCNNNNNGGGGGFGAQFDCS